MTDGFLVDRYLGLLAEVSGTGRTGEMAAELDKLVTSGTIRVLDLLILTKRADGEIGVLEVDDLQNAGELRAAEAQLAGLLVEEDVNNLAAAMEPGTTAGVLVWENVWAGPFAAAARRSGAGSSPTGVFRSKPSWPRSKPTKKENEMSLGPMRRGRRGVIGGPVVRTAAVAGTARVVARGVARRSDRREDRRDDRQDRWEDRRDRR